jgi:lipoate-protein ligase B
LIVSPLLYLGDLDRNANQFLHNLEDVVVKLLLDYGIETRKDHDHPGVWVGTAKLASVGLAVRHGFTFHGFSVNANLDLSPFQLINPCGVPRMPVTSLTLQAGRDITVGEIKPRLFDLLAQEFGLELEAINWSELRRKIGFQALESL